MDRNPGDAALSGRRRWLLGTAALLLVSDALAAGKIEKGVYRVRGDVRVNGAQAKEGMDIRSGDTVVTASGAEIVFVINRDAFLLRANSRLEVGGAAADVFRIVTGALLSVYQPGAPKTLHARTGYEDHTEREKKRLLLRLWLKGDPPRPVHKNLRRYYGLDGIVVQPNRTSTHYQGKAQHEAAR